MGDMRGVWDLPELGLTKTDFERWPGRRRFERSDSHADLLSAAYDAGGFDFPAYAVGECTTYDIAHGHPSFPGARHDFTFFVISGTPGTAWPQITTIRSKGMLSRRIEVSAFPAYDGIKLEQIEPFPRIGYIDIQLTHRSMPVGRIGFGYFKEPPTIAHAQAEAVGDAILKCRAGLLPNAPDG